MGDLVAVGEKLRRSGDELFLILLAGDGVKERAGVEHGGEFAGVEEAGEFRAARVEAVFVAVVVDGENGGRRVGFHGSGGERVVAGFDGLKRDGENLPGGVVVCVACSAWDDEVVAVIAPAQEYADHRFVVGECAAALSERGVYEAKVAQGVAHADGADCGAGGLADEVAAGAEEELAVVLFAIGRTHIRYFWMVNSDEVAMN